MARMPSPSLHGCIYGVPNQSYALEVRQPKTEKPIIFQPPRRKHIPAPAGIAQPPVAALENNRFFCLYYPKRGFSSALR